MNSLRILLITMLLAIGCAPKEPAVPSPAEANTAVVQQLFRHFNDHDWSAMALLYADSAEFLDPSFGTAAVIRTRTQTAAKYAELQAIFPDIRDDVRSVLPSGDASVTVEFVSSATGPDGKRWTLPICTVFELRNGLIVKDHTYYDNE